MGQIAQRIEQMMVAQFAPTLISILDESAKHIGHAGARAGGESHFTLTLVSEVFAGKSPVERHRMVYDVLTPLFDEGLHAVIIRAKTPQES